MLCVERALDVLGATEAVLLALEGEIGDGQALGAHGGEHHLGLIGRHDLIFKSLKENHRTRQLIRVMNGRAFAVEVASLRVRADKAARITRLELVRVFFKSLYVA